MPELDDNPRPRTKLTHTATGGRKPRIAKVTLPGNRGHITVEKEVRQFKMGGGDICGATKASGDPCVLAAGWGTPHPGIGRCKWHGGLNPAEIKTALSKEMKQLLGFQMEIEPYEALLWCIKITAGEVHWLSLQLSTVKRSEWIEEGMQGKRLNVWARQRAEAIERLAKFSKWAIDAGLQERRIQLAENYGEALGRLLKGILDDLHLDRQQREDSPAIVRRHLALLESRNIQTKPEYQDKPLLLGVEPETLTAEELRKTNGHIDVPIRRPPWAQRVTARS
jgi:hypothetical protein